MEHPIFRNRSFLIIYAAGWTLVAAIHFAVLYNSGLCNWQESLADSLVWNALLALLGLFSWAPVRFNPNISGAVFNVIISHLTALIVILLIWVGTAHGIMSLLFENPSYKTFLQSSIQWRIITATLFYLIIALIYYLMIYYQSIEEKLKNESRLNEIVREGELNLLKSQINPHFLFNSLNSVSSLTLTNPAAAQEMIIKLSDFLRYGVSKSNHQFTELEQEVDNVRRYLDIEKVRFGNKLLYEFEIQPESLSCKVPVMILQPIFENAVKHGVYESLEPVCIYTKADLENETLVVEIVNGYDPMAIPVKGTGMGLLNIMQRLRIIYGREDLLQVNQQERSFAVKISLPSKSLLKE